MITQNYDGGAEHLSLDSMLSRRSFLRGIGTAGLALGLGGVAGKGFHYGSEYVGDYVKSLLGNIEREVRENVENLKELAGSIDKKLAVQSRKLETTYSSLENLGIVDPAQAEKLQQILKNHKNIEDHYNFVERAKIFKDRLDRKILSLDSKLESYQPGFMQKLNDKIRGFLGKKSGQAGINHRQDLYDKLTTLCKIYDTNADNRSSQIEVTRQLNAKLEEYLKDHNKLSPEARRLFQFLKEKSASNPSQVKELIKNYKNYDGRTQVLLELRENLKRSESIYSTIKQNQEDLLKAQKLLREGIALKQKIRRETKQDVAKYKKEFRQKANDLKSAVDSYISGLRKKGYNFKTRTDRVNKQTTTKILSDYILAAQIVGSIIVGGVVGVGTGYVRHKGSKAKVHKLVAKEAVKQHNDLVDTYNTQQKELEEFKAGYQAVVERFPELDGMSPTQIYQTLRGEILVLSQDEGLIQENEELRKQLETYQSLNRTYENIKQGEDK